MLAGVFTFAQMGGTRFTTTTGSGTSVIEQWHFRVRTKTVVGVSAHLGLIVINQLRDFMDAETAERGKVHDP